MCLVLFLCLFFYTCKCNVILFLNAYFYVYFFFNIFFNKMPCMLFLDSQFCVSFCLCARRCPLVPRSRTRSRSCSTWWRPLTWRISHRRRSARRRTARSSRRTSTPSPLLVNCHCLFVCVRVFVCISVCIHICDKTPAALSQNCSFLSANLYANSAFGNAFVFMFVCAYVCYVTHAAIRSVLF